MKNQTFNEVRITDLVTAGDQLQQIQSFLEDLNESGQDVHVVLSGYLLTLTKNGTIVGEFNHMTALLTKLRELVTEFEMQHGSMGVR